MNATGSSIDWYRSQYLHWQHAASLVFCLFMFPWKPDFRAALKNLGQRTCAPWKSLTATVDQSLNAHFCSWRADEMKGVQSCPRPAISNQPLSWKDWLVLWKLESSAVIEVAKTPPKASVSVTWFLRFYPTLSMFQLLPYTSMVIEAWSLLQLHLGTRQGLSQSAISSVTQSRKHPEQFPAALPCKSHVNLRQGAELIVVSWCFYVIVALELTLVAYVVATSVCLQCLHAQSDTCAP